MTVLISTDNLKEELGMTKASELLAALDAAGETLEQFGEYVSLAFRPNEPDEYRYTVHLLTANSYFDIASGNGPTPRAAYARACANRTERERKHAIEQEVRARIEAETEAEYNRQYERDEARQEAAILHEQHFGEAA